MPQGSWHRDVAELLEHCAKSLRDGSYRQAIISFGTAVAYLRNARHEGDWTARQLLAQASDETDEGHTQRFTFAPGELEQLAARDREK